MRLLLCAILLSGCASGYASKCQQWNWHKTWYELKIGVVERNDVYRCTSFFEVP